MIIALVVSNLRLMYESYLKYGILSAPFEIILELKTFIFLSLTALLIVICVLITFLAESVAHKLNSYILNTIHFINLTALICVPISFYNCDLIHPSKKI